MTIASRRWWVAPSPAHARLARVTTTLAHRVLVNSDALARRVIDSEGVDPARVVVVPNFVDPAHIGRPTPAERARARAELRLPDDALVIGIIARLDPVKDHETLLRAFAVVRQSFPSARLAVIGDGPLRATLERQAEALGVAPWVVFHGHRDHAGNLHAGLDLSVLCSRHEGFPNTVLEAMAAARPVVATTAGGTGDVVRHGETGLVFEPGDVAALAVHLGTLLSDPGLRARLGEAGLALVQSRYTARQALERIENLYEDCLRLRARRG